MMRYVLIGCGRIAVNHMKAVAANDLELCGICDIVPEHRERLLEKSGMSGRGIRQYTDYREMIEKERPELAAIATESGNHAEIALFCIENGVNLIIEKPIALSMADADAIVQKSREKGVAVSACHQNRFNIVVQELRGALEAGRFGKLSHGAVNIRWNRNEDYYRQAPWRGTWAQDGGALMNQCIHGIDLLRWMMGDEVVSVYGTMRKQFHEYIEAEDIGVAVLQFQNGAVATIEGTTNIYPRNLEETLFLSGENGTVRLGGTSVNTIDVWDFRDGSEADLKKPGFAEQTSNVYGNGHTLLYRDVIDAIRTGRQPYVSAEAGRRALEIVLAVYKSSKTGRPVPLPLTEFRSLDMTGSYGG